MNHKDVTSKIRDEIQDAVRSNGCELLHMELKGGTLKIVLDREDGVTLQDCQTVSRQVSALLDVTDWGPEHYVLEVSSPGLNRLFYSPDDYRRFSGEPVRVTWRNPGTGDKMTQVGILESFNDESTSSIRFLPRESPEPVTILLEQIEATRLEPDI